MKRVKIYSLLFLFVIGVAQIGLCQPTVYNPSLNITTSTSDIKKNGYVNYTTTNASSGDARFTLFGDGYFDVRNYFEHQFPKDSTGFTTTTFFNRKYKKTIPTKRLKSTGETGSGNKTNQKIRMGTGVKSRVATSWSPSLEVENYFLLIFENTSTVLDSGCVEFYYNNGELKLNKSGIIEYSWVSNQVISNVTGSTTYNEKIKWDFKDLLPGEQRVVYIPMTSKLKAGSKISVGSKYISECSSKNGSGASGVSGSAVYAAGSPHDPNVKIPNKSCVGVANPFPQTINYNIRFQNEGNAPAVDVEVRDTIDIGHLDISSINIFDSEYPYTYQIAGNVLIVKFEDINLPGLKQKTPETYTYDDTEAYFSFSICTHPELPYGAIYNQVAVYFDALAPVFTDVAEVKITDDCTPVMDGFMCSYGFKTTNVDDFDEDEIKIVPNPINDVLFIEGLQDQEFTINIYNARGERIKTKSGINNSNNSIQLMYLPSGMYFVQFENEKLNFTQKVIKN